MPKSEFPAVVAGGTESEFLLTGLGAGRTRKIWSWIILFACFSLNFKSGKYSSLNETRISDFDITAIVDKNA